ncbi:unnamed protein product [Coregonus sp. 'balchen']|nr:unnamed protein product [Coregonus sp. 'balchen']
MAFTSLFSSLPNKEFDTTPCESRERFQRDERQLEPVKMEKENERDAQSRKRPLQRGQQSGPRKRKKGDQQEQSGQAKKSTIHKGPPQSYKDFDSVARDYNMVKCDYEQPSLDFSRELDFYSHSKEGEHPGHDTEKSGRKNMRPGEAKGPDQKKDVQGINRKKGRKQWEPHQQRLDNQARGRGGNSARRGGDFTGMGGRGTNQPRDFSNRGGGGSNRGGGGSNRGGGGSNRGGGGSNRGGGGSNRGGEWNNRGPGCDKRGDWSKRGTDQSRRGGRHFPDGRLTLGDDCQLEHALDVNYSINEVCKFYVQGSCSKGQSCIYMHNILFSAYSKCPLCSGCHRALKRDKDIEELAKKNEPISMEEPVATKESATAETKPVIDIFLNPLRPLEKPFRSFFAASISQTSQTQPDPPATTLVPPDSICPPDPTLNSTCGKINVPYSVEAVLGFQKPVEKAFCNQFSGSITQTFPPPTQIQSDPPSNTLVSPDPIRSSDHLKAVHQSHKPVENPVRSLVADPITQSTRHPDIQTQLDPPSTTFNPPDSIRLPDPPSVYKRPAYYSAVLGSPKSLKPSFSSLFAGPISQTSSPQPPTQIQPDSPSTALGPSDSAPPAGCKRPASYSVTAVLEPCKPVENSFCRRFAGTISQTAPDPPSHSLNSPGCKAPASKKPMGKPFRSLFAGPISQTSTNHPPRQTRPNPPSTTFGPPDPIRSSEPLPVCKRWTSSVEAVSESQKSMEKPFRSLFAGPLTQTSTSGHPTQIQPDPPRNFTGCNRPASHSVEAVLETQTQLGKPIRSLFAGPISQTTLPDPPTQTRPYPLHMPPEPTTTNSVLRTLFLRLSPCRQEGEQVSSNGCEDPGGDVLCSSDEDQITRGSTSTGQQSQEVEEEVDEMESEPEECDLRDELLVNPLEPLVPYVTLGDPHHHHQVDITLPRSALAQDVVWSLEDLAPLPPISLSLNHQPSVPLASPSTERTSGPAVGLRPQRSPQDSNSQEAAGEHLIPSRNSGRSQVQVDTPGVHNLPIQAMVRMTPPHTDVQPKRLSGQMRSKSGNLSDKKTLKDLFKTFDPTSSPFGQ